MFFNSEYFGKLSSLRKTKSTHSLNRDVQLQLAKLAMDLSSGGFNEIILASVRITSRYGLSNLEEESDVVFFSCSGTIYDINSIIWPGAKSKRFVRTAFLVWHTFLSRSST